MTLNSSAKKMHEGLVNIEEGARKKDEDNEMHILDIMGEIQHDDSDKATACPYILAFKGFFEPFSAIGIRSRCKHDHYWTK